MNLAMREEDIVIAGAGIAGLTTALGLHRLGVRSVVLESSDMLRNTGFALTLWTNAWRAFDAVEIGDVMRQKSLQIQGVKVASSDSKLLSSDQSPEALDKFGNYESRCLRRKDLLEVLERELPRGTTRYSSKIVSIEESGNLKLLLLADGSLVKTKVLIGCDGVNSIVAKWLGLQIPVSSNRSAIRGWVDYPHGHGLEPKFHAYFGQGVRFGFGPCDAKSLYWFCTFTSSLFKYDEDPLKMKEFVVSSINNAPKQVSDIVQRTGLESISCTNLRFRPPLNILFGNFVQNNVCVVGDALHPMTPDIGQGGSSALEDSIVLVRCLAEALSTKSTSNDDEQYAKIQKGLEKYSKERRWRSFSLITISNLVGFIQESDGKVMSFLKKLFLSRYTVGTMVRMADFDCGKLIDSSS